MDGFTEKKWFVYIGDRHEGPFSLEDIQGQMSQGRVSSETFVWAEGMADWKAMPEVPDFGRLLNPQSSGGAPELMPQDSARDSNGSRDSVSLAINTATPPPQAMPNPVFIQEKVELVPSPKPSSPRPVEKPRESHSAPREMKPRRSWLKFLVVLVLILGGITSANKAGVLKPLVDKVGATPAGAAVIERVRPIYAEGRALFLPYLERIPFLESWLSPIPALEDVSPEERAELKNAAKTRADRGGPRLALALSRNDLLAPVVYLTSNLPDGAAFHITVVGIPETLLNQISFVGHAEVTLNQQMGKSTPIRWPDGKPLSRGEYTLYVTAAEAQPPQVKSFLAGVSPLSVKTPSELPREAKILATKTYFLGGAQDAIYTSRLKDFHDKLRAKARTEIGEVRQFLVTLESQLSSTNTKFSLLKKAKGIPRQKKQWEDFHRDWTKFQGELDQIFSKWTPEALAQDFYYGPLFLLVRQAGAAVEKVHGFHQSFFAGVPAVRDVKSFEIQVGEAISTAQSSLGLLKAKVNQIESLPPTQNGMPRRDGL